VIVRATTTDALTGVVIAINEFTIYGLGAGAGMRVVALIILNTI